MLLCKCISHTIKCCDVFYQPWRPGAKIKYKNQCFKTMAGKKGIGERREEEGRERRREGKEGRKRGKEGKGRGRGTEGKETMSKIQHGNGHSFYLPRFLILKCIESSHWS